MIDNRLQHLKTVLLLGEVVNHAWAASQYVTTPQIPPWHIVYWFSNVFIISGLPVFFFLSGFFAGKRSDEVLTLCGYGTIMKKKIRTLAVPYICWNLLFIVLYLSVKKFVPRIGQRVASFELDTAWGILDSLLGITKKPIDVPLWFIRDLFVIFCFVPIIVWLLKRAWWLLLVGLVFLMIFPFSIYRNWYSLVFFTLGLVAARHSFDLRRLEKWRWVSIPILVIFSIGIYWYMVRQDIYRSDPRLAIWFYFSAILAWLGIARWTNFSEESFFARYVTPASFFIYCSHFLFCSIMLHTIARYVPESQFKMISLYAVFLGLGGCLILGLFMLGKKVCPKWLSVFSGGRLS